MRLECLHLLDRANPDHLWLLHDLFLPDINQDCEAFMDSWNHHPVSGLGHDQTLEVGDLLYIPSFPTKGGSGYVSTWPDSAWAL